MTTKTKKKEIKEPIYLLSPDLKWRAFKELHDKLVRDSGPTPVQMPKVLWGMLGKKMIYCWFDPLIKGDMGLGLKLPKNRAITLITNGKNNP